MSKANLSTPRVTDKLRIVWKIGLAFAAILCCDIALGLFSIDRLRGVEGAAEIVSEHWLPTTRTLGVARAAG